MPRNCSRLTVVLSLLALACMSRVAWAQPLDSSFTYQGQLTVSGAPAQGLFDLQFRLFDAVVGGTQTGATLCLDNTVISGGNLRATLDFGPVFFGQQRFLEIQVRQDTGLGCDNSEGYTTLASRQSLTAAPNASFSINSAHANVATTANTATTANLATSATLAQDSQKLGGQTPGYFLTAGNLTGTLPASLLSGQYTQSLNFSNTSNTFSGSGASLTNLNASSLTSGTIASSRLSGQYSQALNLSNPANIFVGSGAGLSSLSASALTGGTVPSTVLGGTYTRQIALSNPANQYSGTLSGNVIGGIVSGNGSGLNFLNANGIASGTLNAARLPSNWAAGGALTGVYPSPSIRDGAVTRSALSADLLDVLGTPQAIQLAGSAATGDDPGAVAVSGSFAFVVNYLASTLDVFDISNPAAPTRVATVATSPYPSAIAIAGSYAYVVSYSNLCMDTFDIGNPNSPTRVGIVSTSGQLTTSIALSGDFVYLVHRTPASLELFDISNPAIPAQAGTVAIAEDPYSVAVSGSYAYVTLPGIDEIEVFDTSNPAAPLSVGVVGTGDGPISLAVQGSFAFVTNNYGNTLQSFNLSNPAVPTLVATVPTDVQPLSIAVAGSYAYVVGGSHTLQQYRISNPAAPYRVQSVNTGQSASVAAAGSIACVANTLDDTIQVFTGLFPQINFSSPVSAVSFTGSGAGLTGLNASNIATGTLASSVLNGVSGSGLTNLNASSISSGTLPASALSGVSGAGLTSLNASNISSGTLSAGLMPNNWSAGGSLTGTYPNPTIASGAVTRSTLAPDVLASLPATSNSTLGLIGSAGPGGADHVVVSGTIAYVQGSTGFDVYDVSNPVTPVLLSNTASVNFTTSIAVSGSHLFLTSQSPSRLRIYNVSNPASPTFVSSIQTGLDPLGVVVSGSYAYVVNSSSNTLQIFSVSNPAAPTLSGSVPTGLLPFAITVSSSYAYVVNLGSSTLQVFNISNPAAPTLTGSVSTGSTPFGIDVSGSYAYVANFGSNSLQTFNISNPSAPTLTGTVTAVLSPVSVVVSGSYAYVGVSSQNKMQVYDVSNPSSPNLYGTITTAGSTHSIAVSASMAFVGCSSGASIQIFSTINSQTTFATPISAPAFLGSGSGLTDLNASNITLGTLAEARLPSSVARTNTANAFGNFTNTFAGNVTVTGSLSKGGGSFKIDHPLDPENKYLYHSFVESPDMMNVYNGNVTTDADGYATITLPDYFEALNRDFRYQLTVIDEDAPDFHFVRVSSRIDGSGRGAVKNQFVIKSTPGNLDVSWQVTGIRKDAWAEKNRIPNAVDKVGAEKGRYLHPDDFDRASTPGRPPVPSDTPAAEPVK